MTNYREQIENFQNHVESELENAWSEEEKGNPELTKALYNETFKITFKGKTLELYMGACEYESILECLDRIKEEA